MEEEMRQHNNDEIPFSLESTPLPIIGFGEINERVILTENGGFQNVLALPLTIADFDINSIIEDNTDSWKGLFTEEEVQLLLSYLFRIHQATNSDKDFPFARYNKFDSEFIIPKTEENEKHLQIWIKEQMAIQAILEQDKDKAVQYLVDSRADLTDPTRLPNHKHHNKKRKLIRNPFNITPTSFRQEDPIIKFLTCLPEYITELEYLAVIAVLIYTRHTEKLSTVIKQWRTNLTKTM